MFEKKTYITLILHDFEIKSIFKPCFFYKDDIYIYISEWLIKLQTILLRYCVNNFPAYNFSLIKRNKL